MASSTRWRLYFTDSNSTSPPYIEINDFWMSSSVGGSNLCTGGTPSAESSYGSGFEASKAFDADGTTGWSSDSTLPTWLEYQFAGAVTIVEYRIKAGYGNYPKTWELQSYNGSTWDTEDTRTNITGGWSNLLTRTYSFGPSDQSVSGATIASGSTSTAPSAVMFWALIAQTGGYINPDGGTSGAINTTGADLLVISIPYYSNTGFQFQTTDISDSKSNTWFALARHGSAGQAEHRFFYAKNPTVGSGHTFTINSSGNFTYPSPTYSAFSGADLTSPFDVENGYANNLSSPQSTGSITPSVNGCLIISAEAVGNATPGSVTPSMVTDTREFGAFGYLEQVTAAAINPSWSWTGGSQAQGLSVASFKPAIPASAVQGATITSASTVFGPSVPAPASIDGAMITLTSTLFPVTISFASGFNSLSIWP